MKYSTTEPIAWDDVEDFWKNLMQVCDRHRIELTSDRDVPWKDLAIALLLRHEPSFRLFKRGKVGRPREWKRDIALILDADHVIGERRCSDSGAIHILTTSPRFVQRWKGENERTLRNRLSAARKDERVAAMLQGAHKQAQDRGLNLWQVINQDGAYQFKKRGRPPKKAKAAQKARKAASQRPKPMKEMEVPKESMTKKELEALRQARTMVQ
ncbi:hypothetical protein [Mesorhizobium sp. B4-1-4]|uniref:hypothetical protein n=1 Tax=Mesorhizobium sp. B4-1-4 TaxID=2589888 RepID=UPI00112AF442|nr:hypothetical protein [Mesorhizobium sp. B4-1-4]UCI33216.1 hypothetical protein FJW03_07205 [Mesorhizobium sp. B4-1-4]